MDETLKKALEARFTQKDLYPRITLSGQTLTYIRTAAIVDRLNRVYGHGGWSFEVLDHENLAPADEIIVRGRLQVPGATFTQYGNATYSGRGFSRGDSLKTASSDCLARCAYLLGIGSYLRRRKRATGKKQPQHSPDRQQPTAPDPLSKRQHNYLLQLANCQGISANEMDAHCQFTYGTASHQISKQQASVLIDSLRCKRFELNAA